MKNVISISVAVAIVLTGCTMSSYKEGESVKVAAREQIANAPQWERSAAVYTTAPPPLLESIKAPEGPAWLHATVSHPIRFGNLPFDMAVEEVLEGTGVVPRFDYEVDPGLLVSMTHEGTVRGALQKLAARSNYGFEAKDNVVEWRAYETRTWTLPVAGGDYSYMIGKSGGSGAGGSTGGGGGSGGMQNTIDTSAFDVDLQQFSNTEADGLNYFTDAENTIASMVGDYGIVVPSRASSTIMVKTTPDRMRTVSDYMDNVMIELLSQVLLEVKVVQVTTSSGADAGINWASVKEMTRSQLDFVGESASTMFTNSVPVGFSGNRQTGSGSVDVLVRALEEQGDVAFITEQRVLTRSGKLSELELADIQGYLARSQVTNTTDIGSSQELEPGIIQSGYTLYSYSKIFGDRVAMVISNRSSDLEPFETVGSEENFIQLPSMKSNRFNVQQIVRDGTTVVAAAVRREETSSRQNSPISARFLPSYSGSETSVMDIYVLVTPRIIRDL